MLTERVTPELQKEIQTLLQTARKKMLTGSGGGIISWAGSALQRLAARNKVIRLFRKDNCRYSDKQVHEEIETSGTVGKLRNRLLHYTYCDLRHYLAKWDDYTWKSANDRAAKTPEVTLFHLWAKTRLQLYEALLLPAWFS